MFNFFKKNKPIESGKLVKFKNKSMIKSLDKDYYIVINYIPNKNFLNENDELDDMNMVGVVWGINDEEIIKSEIHLRLWNPMLNKFIIVSQKYLEEI